jgi:hypothetical protein
VLFVSTLQISLLHHHPFEKVPATHHDCCLFNFEIALDLSLADYYLHFQLSQLNEQEQVPQLTKY